MKNRSALFGYLFTSHWVLGFLLFTLYPLVYSLIMSMQKIMIGADGIEGTFVGFDNFVYAFSLDFRFLTGMAETVRTIGILTPLIIILSIIIGLLLNRVTRMKGIFRALFFLPVIIVSGNLMSMLEADGVFAIVSPEDVGLFRWLAGSGMGAVLYVITFLISNIFTVLWFSGVQILIYLSGMQKISGAIYEAAAIDGASGWQTFWKITLPQLNQFTVINIVYTVVLIATFPTNPIIQMIREDMFGMRAHQGMGYASAVSWMYFILIVLMLLIFLFLVGFKFKKRKEAR
jgi:ABC-type sugar transport system permease subunit